MLRVRPRLRRLAKSGGLALDPLERRRLALVLEQIEHAALDSRADAVVDAAGIGNPREHPGDRPTGQVAVEHARVDVRPAGDRGRVAEQLGDASRTARLIARLRAVLESRRVRAVASDTAAITVAFQVRKSLALNSSPSWSLRYSLMSSERSRVPAAPLAIGEQLLAAAAPALQRRDQP